MTYTVKNGTWCKDNEGAMTGVYLQIDSFIQKFNK